MTRAGAEAAVAGRGRRGPPTRAAPPAGRRCAAQPAAQGQRRAQQVQEAPVTDDEVAERLLARIRDVPDYPNPGIVFKDITPLLADAAAFAATIDALAAASPGRRRRTRWPASRPAASSSAPRSRRPSASASSRCARRASCPGDVVAASYDLEYGEATIEVTADAFSPGARVLVVDDVLATGGTAAATVELVRRCGAEVVGLVVLLELGFLSGRAALAAVGRPRPEALLVV